MSAQREIIEFQRTFNNRAVGLCSYVSRNSKVPAINKSPIDVSTRIWQPRQWRRLRKKLSLKSLRSQQDYSVGERKPTTSRFPRSEVYLYEFPEKHHDCMERSGGQFSSDRAFPVIHVNTPAASARLIFCKFCERTNEKIHLL